MRSGHYLRPATADKLRAKLREGAGVRVGARPNGPRGQIAWVRCTGLPAGNGRHPGLVIAYYTDAGTWVAVTEAVRLEPVAGPLQIDQEYLATRAANDADKVPVFVADGASLIPVRALAEGTSVPCRPVGRASGSWTDVGATITATVLDAARNEPFRSGWRYFAVLVGNEWFADTGPKTKCVTVFAPGGDDCAEVGIRVIADPTCDPGEMLSGGAGEAAALYGVMARASRRGEFYPGAAFAAVMTAGGGSSVYLSGL